jgi:predicted GIY-YIG superfamily endonuclease
MALDYIRLIAQRHSAQSPRNTSSAAFRFLFAFHRQAPTMKNAKRAERMLKRWRRQLRRNRWPLNP